LERLRRLLDEKGLRVELKENGLKRLKLRQNYGDKISRSFGMTRQGVRWRFQRLMDMYTSAYETILFIESNFGTELRNYAMAIAKQRANLYKKAQQMNKTRLPRRQTMPNTAESEASE